MDLGSHVAPTVESLGSLNGDELFVFGCVLCYRLLASGPYRGTFWNVWHSSMTSLELCFWCGCPCVVLV